MPHEHAPRRASLRPSSPRPRRLTATAVAAAGLLASGLLAAPASAVPQPGDASQVSSFTLAVLPDTQFYSRYATPETGNQFAKFGSNPFASQTTWLTDNAKELGIPFVAHLGDVVDQVGKPQQWTVADQAMKPLEAAGLPYSILAGNHDVLDSSTSKYDDQYDLAKEPYLGTFPASRAAAQTATFGGADKTGFNTWHTFAAEGRRFLVLALSWNASDATLAWANQVIADHPTLPVILTTHSLIAIEADAETPLETSYGLRLWDKLIRKNDQIFLTFNGHSHGATRLTKKNDFGHDVHEVLLDYQMAYQGGNGYLGLYEFDFTNKRINAEGLSPWVVTKPKELLTPFDQAVLKGKHQQYDIPIDFDERFRGFNPDFGATGAQPTHGSRTERAKQLVLDGYTEPDAVAPAKAQSTEDYPKVPGTVAHWRPGAAQTRADGVLREGGVVPDVAHGDDLHRVSIVGSGSKTAEVGDVTIERDDLPGFSSDDAAVCFENSDSRTGRFSYLSTGKGAAVNDAKLDDGYTIETFVKLDQGWTAEANQWSKALVRSGKRADIPGTPYDRWAWTVSPTVLGISNLREFQYSTLPGDATKGDRVAWSGEIMPGTWSHVAIVNDGTSITMSVDGAPVLRNATDAKGMSANAGMAWLLGADWDDDTATNGWNGCIGETRIVDHAIPSSEWLTARVLAPPTTEPGGPARPAPGAPQPPVATPAVPSIPPAATTIAAVPGAGPRVVGAVRVGRTLRAEAGRWSATGASFAYQWLRDGRPIAGATGATYRVRATDVGHRLTVRVTAAHGAARGAAVATATRRIARVAPTVAVRARAASGGRATVTVRVRATGAGRVAGRVAVTVDGRTVRRSVAVRGGVATVRLTGLRAGRHRVVARYRGTQAVAPAAAKATLRAR
ncbi:Ig-like domain repeat protein [Patulibacter sp. SYSU D01012]|uniref:LamG-like jellyroll fold domain-containing protein n=1 Tax=Patulibacter sp. SYSU D01012 TaxID=2817381 RepID=UPI001B316EBB